MSSGDIFQSTRAYEEWLRKQLVLIEADLKEKHDRMARDAFSFLRATFYRWIEIFPGVASDAARAPQVLAVGDLHIENFGTWRDTEGRLVWGINDFDEAYPLPYTMDLLRLATSACLAIEQAELVLKPKDACQAILEGYSEGLLGGGKPLVLGEKHVWLREIALEQLKDPVAFWDALAKLPESEQGMPAEARTALEQMLPEPGLRYRLSHRSAGLGSRGRQRFVALADWRGGKVARETRPLVPSVCTQKNGDTNGKVYYAEILRCAVRCLDPYVRLQGRWIVRRLAPDCTKIELASLPEKRKEEKLLHAMGWETANVHLGSKDAIAGVRRDLARRPSSWLHDAANRMVQATLTDWNAWKTR